MSTAISPSVSIFENFTAQSQIPDGYQIAVFGFTSEGIANEPFIMRSISDFIALFGAPDPSRPEQIYAYDAAKRIIDSGANLVFTKLPYGACEGYDVGEEYTALVYPALVDNSLSSATIGYEMNEFIPASSFGALSGTYPFDDDIEVGEVVAPDDFALLLSAYPAADFTEVTQQVDCEGYVLGEPVRMCLTEEEYDQIKCNQIDWSGDFTTSILSSFDSGNIGHAGMIVLDSGRSKTNDAKEGYFISVTDNSDGDPATDYDALTGIKTSFSLTGTTWDDVPDECYDFNLTSPFTSSLPSLSQTAAALASQKIDTQWENGEYKNYLNVTLWRLRQDVENGSGQLVPQVVESHVGSVSESETRPSDGGRKRNVFLEDVVDGNSNRLCVVLNPRIKQDTYTDTTGTKIKNVRVYRNSPDVLTGLPAVFPPLGTFTGVASNAYSISKYTPKEDRSAFDVGDIPIKLKNAMCASEDPERLEIDLTVEAGLGTIWTTVKEDPDSWQTGDQRDCSFVYDDCSYLDVKEDLGRAVPEGTETGEMRNHWREIFDCFLEFSEKTRVCNGGNTHLHIADPLRQIFVNSHCKVYTAKNKCKQNGAFAECIYWPLKNLTRGINTSLATLDANWFLDNNIYSSGPTWVPSSGVVAALFASTPNPWDAAAGVNRGNITSVLDGAISPSLRERDLLWKLHANASYFDRAADTYLRFADQTLLKNDDIQLRNNSARRLLTWLYRNLRFATKPFLFEANNLQTRVRFRNAIEVYLQLLLQSGAIEDYQISLSGNTLSSQQEGCLIADVGIKITGVAERIKLNFDIYRLDQPFSESF